MLDYQNKSVEKINQIRFLKKKKEEKLTFTPKINKSYNKTNLRFLEKIKFEEKNRKKKLKIKKKKLVEKKEKEFFINCTFSPQINKNEKMKRSIQDLFLWKKKNDKKNEEKKKLLEIDYSFKPKLCQKSVGVRNEIFQYDNPGERLYNVFKIKNDNKNFEKKNFREKNFKEKNFFEFEKKNFKEKNFFERKNNPNLKPSDFLFSENQNEKNFEKKNLKNLKKKNFGKNKKKFGMRFSKNIMKKKDNNFRKSKKGKRLYGINSVSNLDEREINKKNRISNIAKDFPELQKFYTNK